MTNGQTPSNTREHQKLLDVIISSLLKKKREHIEHSSYNKTQLRFSNTAASADSQCQWSSTLSSVLAMSSRTVLISPQNYLPQDVLFPACCHIAPAEPESCDFCNHCGQKQTKSKQGLVVLQKPKGEFYPFSRAPGAQGHSQSGTHTCTLSRSSGKHQTPTSASLTAGGSQQCDRKYHYSPLTQRVTLP